MKSYRKIIEEERAKLEQNISWWPLYFYHFTDVYNAVSIIKSEYIYSRHTADKEKLMSSDNASPNVINITDKKVTEYARLYMRPKTPTQYHNEGHKPEHIRNQDLNANCPIPIFFFLDAEKMLSMDGVKIVEKGLAGHSLDREFISGPEAYSSLNFDKIFHNGSHLPGSDITQYKHTEVVREGGIPIPDIIRGIVCRSIAEKQTLLYLLKNSAPYNKYIKYKSIISFKPDTDVFFNNGIFIKKVKFEEDTFYIELNDSERRYNKDNANGKDVYVEVFVDWLGKNQEVLSRSIGHGEVGYGNTNIITFTPKSDAITNYVLIKVTFDGCLMYQNIVNLDKFEIV